MDYSDSFCFSCISSVMILNEKLFQRLDGFLQSVPYHIYVFLFPMHKVVYLVLFICVNIWTISIHDGEYFTHSQIINGAAHHTLHHLYFNYNYGQYFTLVKISAESDSFLVGPNRRVFPSTYRTPVQARTENECSKLEP